MAIAAAALLAARLPLMEQWGLGALTLAILFGIALGNAPGSRLASVCDTGIAFAKTRLLRLGIILYGFHITFQQIFSVGWAGFAIDAAVVACTFLLALVLGRRLLKLDMASCVLIGAGSAICGAAAVLATASITRGQAHKVSIAVATVVVFGTVGMFLYPVLYQLLPLSDAAFGIYLGSTVHEVAQVMAAGQAVSEGVAATAIITKMLRVMLLAPFLLLLGRLPALTGRRDVRDRSRPSMIPWFALLFIAASGIHSTQVLPGALTDGLARSSTALLAMAMAALGLHTRLAAIRQAGLKPLLLAGMLFVFLMVGGYGINHAALRLL
jgi:uncharacterized integral membrane protein (TIGR00698 family)